MSDTHRTSLLPGRTGDVIAAISGLVMPLAFEPFTLWPLVFLALGALFLTWIGVDAKRAAIRAFVFGLASFGFGTSWIYHSLHTFGGMPSIMAAVAVALFVGLLALFPAIAAYAAIRSSGRLPLWLCIPAAWAIGEWLRGLGLWAFPWLAAGFSQADSPLAGYAPVLGVYGVSFFVALVSACAAHVAFSLVRQEASVRAIVVQLGLVALVCVGGSALYRVSWSMPDADPISVALVQGNVDIEKKWLPGQEGKTRQRYMDLSTAAAESDLVVWPESAMPVLFSQLTEDFYQELSEHQADFVFGVLEYQRDQTTGRETIYNSAAVVADEADVKLWRKSHLVPFGEYMPFGDLLRFVLDYLNLPMSDIRPYDGEQGAIAAADTMIGISICFEDAFPRDMRPTLPEARVLVHISEDAWFGDSFGPPQRLEMGRIRALEFARPMVRASNTGVTAILDEKGRVSERLKQFNSSVLVGDVVPQSGSTPFLRLHHWPVLALSLSLLAFGYTGRARR